MTKFNYLCRDAAVKRMNELGHMHRPFFFLIDFDEKMCIVEEPDNLSESILLFDFPNASSAGLDIEEENYRNSRKGLNPKICTGKKSVSQDGIVWETSPQSFMEYSKSFDIVIRNIYAGNSFLTNLTCETPLHTNLSLEDIFFNSKAKYRLWLKDKFVMFSPEIFVRIENGMIFSHPMKGTIDADIPDAETKILNDVKESAEHATITDLIRNDLSRIADEVTVTRYRYTDRLDTHKGPLLQVSSEIRGRLPEDYCSSLGSLFFQLLPAGSITGAPKKKTVEIIREAETYDRGFYTGVTGYFDGKNLDSAVIIRYVELKPDGSLSFKSGGGITFMSDARSEYDEMIRKVYVPLSPL